MHCDGDHWSSKKGGMNHKIRRRFMPDIGHEYAFAPPQASRATSLQMCISTCPALCSRRTRVVRLPIQTSSNDAAGILNIGTGFGGTGFGTEIVAIYRSGHVGQKNGSLPEDKLPLRLCWGHYPLASPVAACSASGFRSKSVNGWWFSTCPLALLRFGFQPAIGPVT